MTRFVRLRPLDHPVGERLRLELVDGRAILADETVWHEQVNNPDANHYETHELIELPTIDLVRWLHQATGELLSTMELGEATEESVGDEAVDLDSDATQPMGVDGRFDGSEGSKR